MHGIMFREQDIEAVCGIVLYHVAIPIPVAIVIPGEFRLGHRLPPGIIVTHIRGGYRPQIGR